MGLKIEKAICLCLDKRKEHWEDLENQCALKGIPFEKFMVGKGEIFPKDQYDYNCVGLRPSRQWHGS